MLWLLFWRVEFVVLRKAEERNQRRRRFFFLDFMLLLFCLFCLVLGCCLCCYTLRRAESDIIVEASGDEITVMEREEDLHLQAKRAPRIHTHCVYTTSLSLSLFLCVCYGRGLRCFGCSLLMLLLLLDGWGYFSSFIRLVAHPLTPHREEREGTHPSIGRGECEGVLIECDSACVCVCVEAKFSFFFLLSFVKWKMKKKLN